MSADLPQDVALLIDTADHNGDVSPSMLFTPASDAAKTSGLLGDVYVGNMNWQRLTAAGMEIKRKRQALRAGEATAPDEPAPDDFLAAWQEWERRTGNTESKLEMYSDGSGEFTERDLYGPTHAFDSLEHLTEILKP